MHIWKTIRQLPDRTPVPVDLALEALRPSSPKALLLRFYNAGHLLEELEPNAIMKAAKDYFAAIGEATNQFDKRLAPVETMTPYLANPSTWARLHILREELLALRAALRLESLRAARRARLESSAPADQGKKDLNPKRERTLLKFIGALLTMRYTGAAYEKGDARKNVSSMATRLQQDMATANINDDGLKDRTLRDLIPLAMEAIKENMATEKGTNC